MSPVEIDSGITIAVATAIFLSSMKISLNLESKKFTKGTWLACVIAAFGIWYHVNKYL